jgi:hypothetical protein
MGKATWLTELEEEGQQLTQRLIDYISTNHGQYLRDRDGSVHVIIGGQRIAINAGSNNLAMARLMRNASTYPQSPARPESRSKHYRYMQMKRPAICR